MTQGVLIVMFRLPSSFRFSQDHGSEGSESIERPSLLQRKHFEQHDIKKKKKKRKVAYGSLDEIKDQEAQKSPTFFVQLFLDSSLLLGRENSMCVSHSLLFVLCMLRVSLGSLLVSHDLLPDS